ncbi:unnamed protein product [Durusdinium trenchii]|uniref:Uncharacterized protein n=1 Tax=Durusdinium trenchii TaxID=1381693 RepID=A0ABP0NCW0_9DINO
MKRDADIKQSYARRHEIERELRMKVPSLSEFDAGKIAAAIDKHENFDRPQSLRVTAGVLDTKLTLHTLQQGGTKKVVQKYPRSNMLEKALKEIIREQQETLFPLRKEINIAYRKFFIGFPSISGRPCSVPTLGKELETLSPEKRVELQKQLLEDFRRRFIGFEQYLRKRKRDVQQVLKKEWMPLELRRAFVAFDMLCMKSEWFTPFYRLAGSHDGRMRAGAWLRRDPELRSPAVHIAEEVDLQFMLRVQRALPWQLRHNTLRYWIALFWYSHHCAAREPPYTAETASTGVWQSFCPPALLR